MDTHGTGWRSDIIAIEPGRRRARVEDWQLRSSMDEDGDSKGREQVSSDVAVEVAMLTVVEGEEKVEEVEEELALER